MTDYSVLAVQFCNEDITQSIIEGWVNQFAYQGFDAAVIIRLLVERGGSNWKEDAKKMIILALTRGNKPDKMIKKMSVEGRKTVEALVAKYRIVGGRPGREDLTFTRIAAALCGWTIQAIPHLHTHLPVTGNQMDQLVGGTYPRAMMHPSFAGMMDRSMESAVLDELIAAHSLFMIQFTITINPALRAEPKGRVVSSFEQPMYAAINSEFMPLQKKVSLLQAAGILDVMSKPTAAVTAAARVFRAI